MKQTIFFLLFALFLIPTPTAAQGVPGWAQPQDSRGRSFGEKPKRERPSEQVRPEKRRQQYQHQRLGDKLTSSPDNPSGSTPGATTQDYCDPMGYGQGFTDEASIDQRKECANSTPPSQCAYCQCLAERGLTVRSCDTFFANQSDPIPVDDYLPLLALAGIAFGVYRIKMG